MNAQTDPRPLSERCEHELAREFLRLSETVEILRRTIERYPPGRTRMQEGIFTRELAVDRRVLTIAQEGLGEVMREIAARRKEVEKQGKGRRVAG